MASTQLPIVALTPLARLKARYDCGPIPALDDEQRALLAEVEQLYPHETLRVLDAVLNSGRLYVTGADVWALSQRAGVEQ